MDYTHLFVRVAMFALAMGLNVAFCVAIGAKPLVVALAPVGSLIGWVVADLWQTYRQRQKEARSGL